MASFGRTAGGESDRSGPANEGVPILRGSGGFAYEFFCVLFFFQIFFFCKNKKGKSHVRKRTIRQGQISQRRRSKIPFMEHNPETKRRKEERRASGEATIREDSSREERRRQDKRKQETRGEDERLHQKRQSEKRASRVFPTVPQAHKEKLFPPSSPLLGASCLFPSFFSPGCLLLVLCLGLS